MSDANEEVDLGLSFDFAVGVRTGNECKRHAELLKGNGVTEKVFLKRIPDKVYTWMGNVLAVAIKSLGGEEIAIEARETYIKSGAVVLPTVLKKMPLADANSGLMEVHRRLWQNLVPNQTCLCKFCGQAFQMDIDLNRVEYTELSKQWIEAYGDTTDKIELVAELKDGYEFVPYFKEANGSMRHDIYAGTYKRFIFRAPTLEDGIRNEKYAKDEVAFWRRMAFDCLVRIERDGETLDETETVVLPTEIGKQLGLRMYDTMLSAQDLKKIRNALKEVLPTLPFVYEETCPHCERQTPIAIEATSFFSA